VRRKNIIHTPSERSPRVPPADPDENLPLADDSPHPWASSKARYSRPGDRDEYADYRDVPVGRRSETCTGQLILGIFFPCLFFFVWWVCFKVLTGDIYYADRDSDGRLKKWGAGNRVAAVVLLVLQIGVTIYLVATNAGG
jgi:hypothetical protein